MVDKTVFSDEHRRKIAQSLRKPRSEEAKAKLREGQKKRRQREWEEKQKRLLENSQ